MAEKILFVDDEPLILDSLKRELSMFKMAIDTAQSGAEGLEKIAQNGPYAVVVADYRMPRQNGIQFLAEVMKAAPDTVKMMLSGNADLQIAMEAVNQGQIFRLMTKPCEPGVLVGALEAGIHQYRLVTAEKELLEKTLVESINMLTEVLSIVNPKAYGKSYRVRELVHFISRQMKLPGAWQYEMAAALSQVGWIIFPSELLDKLAQHRELTVPESVLYSRHPFTTRKLLEKIPRLELIARIIEGQNRSIEDLCLDDSSNSLYFVDLGSHILNICVDYDQLIVNGMAHEEAMAYLYREGRKYKKEILAALGQLKSVSVATKTHQVEEVTVENLEVGMLVVEAVRDGAGNLLIDKNTLVSRTTIVQLYKLTSRQSFSVQPIKIIRPNKSY